jgi:hypothetical protein
MGNPKGRRAAQRTPIDWAPLAVAIASMVPFLPSLTGRLVWDDLDYVRNNPILHAALPAAVTKIATSVVVGNYHPLTMASLAIDNALAGPAPTVFHVTNLVLHAVNAVLVGRLVLALGAGRGASWAAALLWAVHPLRVESVAWISGRKDLLYVLFFLGALLAYLRHVEEDEGWGRWYLAALGLFAASLLSKGAAVSLVPVLLLVDWLTSRAFDARVWLEKAPFLVLAIAMGAVAIEAQKTVGAMPSTPAYGMAGRLAIACYGLVFYLVRTVAPWGLSAFYPYPAAAEGLPAPVLGAVPVVVAGVAALVWLRRPRILTFAAGFFAATVALVLQVIPVGGAVAADRYSYLPAVGISVAIAAGLTIARRKEWIVAAVIVVGAFSAATWARCAVWHDGLSLWNDVLAKNPGVPIALQNRGVARDAAGDRRGAIDDYTAAIAASPGYADAWANRGAAKADLHDLDGAIADLERAIVLDPSRASYRFNLGLTLGDKGRWEDALRSLGEAIRLNPEFAAAYLNRGLALEQMGRAAEGGADVRRARELGYPVPPQILQRFP